MPRKVLGGLIQAAAPITDPAAPIAKVRDAAIDVHLPFIEEAGKRGVQILGLQEVFNGPYFGMRAAVGAVPAFTDNAAVVDDHTAYHGVRADQSAAMFGELQSALHPLFVRLHAAKIQMPF